jgi:hypothetical protein
LATVYVEYHRDRYKTSPGDHFWHNPSVHTSLWHQRLPPQKGEATLDFDSDKCFTFLFSEIVCWREF